MPIPVRISSWLPHTPTFCNLLHSQVLEKLKAFNQQKKITSLKICLIYIKSFFIFFLLFSRNCLALNYCFAVFKLYLSSYADANVLFSNLQYTKCNSCIKNHFSKTNIKVNKSVYIASHTYRFC